MKSTRLRLAHHDATHGSAKRQCCVTGLGRIPRRQVARLLDVCPQRVARLLEHSSNHRPVSTKIGTRRLSRPTLNLHMLSPYCSASLMVEHCSEPSVITLANPTCVVADFVLNSRPDNRMSCRGLSVGQHMPNFWQTAIRAWPSRLEFEVVAGNDRFHE